MKTKQKLLVLGIIGISCLGLSACSSKADTTKYNIQTQADKFEVYRRMTFINLYTNSLLYSAEGYFSVQTTYNNEYQGQQEIGLVFKVAANEYKMNYFSIAENVTYVIEQLENTHTNPYFYEIVWYVPGIVITNG